LYVAAHLSRPAATDNDDIHQAEAVDRFADWLVTLVVEREVAHGTGGGAGKAKIVLCGHRYNQFHPQTDPPSIYARTSMGGLLAADILIQLADSRVDKVAPLWPRVIALIAFDTPVSPVAPRAGCAAAKQRRSTSACTRSCSGTI
jgi:hypothetical protein